MRFTLLISHLAKSYQTNLNLHLYKIKLMQTIIRDLKHIAVVVTQRITSSINITEIASCLLPGGIYYVEIANTHREKREHYYSN